jgi:hypothetical protein
MRNLLYQLENNEAILLMYLAGELPAEDHAEVEQMLASDAALRAELEMLRQAQDGFARMMSLADQSGISPVVESAHQAAAVRQVSRAMVRLHLEGVSGGIAAHAHATSRQSLRLPGWMYPFAGAAIVLIGWVAYWGFSNGGSGRRHLVDEGYPLIHGNPTTGNAYAEDSTTPDPSNKEFAQRDLPSLGVDDQDRNMLAISAGAFDVSSMFPSERE